jgi:transcriptional regulator with XRE-family HTH domain/AraC-like DNA-binding protein
MLLERLLHSLSDEELFKLQNDLKLPERSARIFERLSQNALEPSTKELCNEFGLSKTNLYRICSEIADECVHILATAGEFPKLEFYRRKFMASEFYAELARTEARITKEADPDMLERFYELAFNGIIGFPVTYIDEMLLRSYGMKWYQSRKNPPPDGDLEVEARVVFVRVCALPSWKKKTVEMMNKEARTLIDSVKERASVSENPGVRYYYYQSEWKASNYDNISGEERASWVRRLRDHIAAHPSFFPAASLESTELLLAYERAMYCGETEAGFESFHRAYRGQTPETSQGTIFLTRYVRLAIIVGRLDTAREIFAVFDGLPFTRKAKGIYQMYLLLRAALHIQEGELEQAERLNAISRTLNADKDYFLSYEVEIRSLELICALKRNDFELAELIIARDLKWLHSRRYSLSQGPWPYFYQTIKAAVLYEQTAERPRPSLKKHFEEFKMVSPLYASLIAGEVKEMFGQ